MKQRIANALQIAGAIGLVATAAAVSVLLGLFVGALAALVAGVVLERD